MEVGTAITEAKRIIESGRVVAFPTGTSYGLAVDVLQGHALQRLRNLKQRPDEKTFTLFLREDRWPDFLTLTAAEEQLLRATAGQPLTLLVRAQETIAHVAQDERVGLRVIDHPLMQALAEAVAVPLTATSANIAGQTPCYTPAEIAAAFPGVLPTTTSELEMTGPTTYDLSLGYVLDGGALPHRPATTIARVNEDNSVAIIRPGTLSEADLTQLLAA